jgi:Zn-dependent membrane protease YugP
MMHSPYFWVFIATVIPSAIAAIMVKVAFSKWSKVSNSSGISGAEAAQALLTHAGIRDVGIEHSRGMLSDHYDPRSRTLRLSKDVYSGRSVAAVGVALHEAGHALQHAQQYAPLALRSALVPVASIGSGYLPVILIFVGLALSAKVGPMGMGLALTGFGIFAVATLFTFVTLPVEFNASSRAKEAAVQFGIVAPGREAQGVSAVLNAAALTYVAAAVTSLLWLLYYANLIFNRR